jgi:outer membrane receptor protein involved in Fe transport
MKLARCPALCVSLLLATATARAEPGAETQQVDAHEQNMEALEALLDESVVTTASRAAERASSAPATVFSISAEDMRAFGVRSVDEALALLGVGIHVQKARDYNTGLDVGAQGIMLRDYGRHLLVLLDGHVMNSQASGEVTLHEGLGVPLEAIDHIEVMLGAGSVIYGANAMTAVVHIFTRSAERDRGEHVVSELSVAAPVGTDGYTRLPGGAHQPGYHYRIGVGSAHSFELGKVAGSLALRAEWQQDVSQTYAVTRVSGEWELRPGETTWGGAASHDMHVPSTVATLRVGDFTLRAQGSRYQRTMPLVGLFDDQEAREIRGAARLDLSHSRLLSESIRLRSRVYADYSSADETSNWSSPWWCLPGQIDGCHFRLRNVSRWIGLEQQLSFEPRADGSLSTSIGYDVRLRDSSGRTAEYRDYVTNAYPITTELPYFHTQSVLGALFAQQLYSPVRWLTLNLGGRVDLDSVFGVRLSPRAALLLAPFDNTSIRASYAEAFRGPTALELNQSDATYVIPPSSLGPEIVRTAELEWQQRIGMLSFSLRGYAAFYKHLIDTRPASDAEVERAVERGELASTADLSWIVTSDNLNSVRSYGGSATLQLKPIEDLTIAGSFTASRSFSDGPTLTLWPHSFGNARVAYRFASSGATLGLVAVFAHHRRSFNDREEVVSRSQNPVLKDQVDLRLTFCSPVRKLPGLSVRSSIGARLLPDQPYLVTAPTMADPAYPVQYQHDLPQLHVLVGANYDF